MHTREEKIAAFGRLLDIMDTLREQCPWNAAQTFESIRPLSEEEVYELSDTILKAMYLQEKARGCGFDWEQKEDVEGSFDIADSINKVCDKMVFRHPHVFGPEAGKPTTAKEIADTWELVKAQEKDGNKRVMSGIPYAMPAILKAMSLQEKARGCGFGGCLAQGQGRTRRGGGRLRRKRSRPHAGGVRRLDFRRHQRFPPVRHRP